MKKFLGLFSFLLFASPAWAEEGCIQTTSPTSYIHISKIDLDCPNVQLQVSEPEDNGLTVSEFSRKYQAAIAINGSFFRTDLTPIGLTISNYKRWEKTQDFRNKVFFACEQNNRCFIESRGSLSRINPKWQWAISGWQSYDAQSGKFECAVGDKVGCKENIFDTKHPRTMIGLDVSRRWLYLVVVEGRQLIYQGMSLSELAELAQSLNLDRAVNLDGGGSSVMLENQHRRSSLPLFQAQERAVANHLGVILQKQAN